jgi:ABC-type lipoprotein release transport system permease subunit
MLIVEKNNDAGTLRALGADSAMLHSIFRNEGFLIVFIGTLTGVLVGLGLCIAQLQFSFILMAGEGSLPYPINIKPFDVAGIFVIVMAVGSLVGWLTTRRTVQA